MTTEQTRLPSPRTSVLALLDDAIAVRRDLHRHPELSTEEHRTQEVILERLRGLGLEDVRAVAGTGATAIVRGSEAGPNILWRADVDALPIEEATGLEFASENRGVMHACAHDGHVAIALALAEALQASRASLRGSVRFAFQPAEERIGGAVGMIDGGVMDDPPTDAVYGLHIWSTDAVGTLSVVPGSIFAAATHMRIIVRGRGGHASAPHTTIDPIVVAAHVIVALQTVVSRSVDPAETAVLTIGRIEGGARGNIIPAEVKMSGTMRTFEPRVSERMIARVEQVVAGVTAAWGAEYQFDHSTLPAVVNDARCAGVVETVGCGFLGDDRVSSQRITGSDDMAYYLQRAPGAYFLLGAAGAAVPPRAHHSAQFDFDERAIGLGAEVALRIIETETSSTLG